MMANEEMQGYFVVARTTPVNQGDPCQPGLVILKTVLDEKAPQ